MNNKVVNFIAFTAGAAVGSVVTWKLLKTKYEKIAQEEIDSVKEVFSRREKELKNKVDDVIESKPEEPTESDEQVTYKETLNNLGYTNYSDMSKKDDEPASSVDPYVISPDEFGCAEGYDFINLTYYSDGILADDDGDIIEDIEGTIGSASLRRFGEYEPDVVHVRNDVRKVDYEICRDNDTYEEADGRAYRRMEE